MSCITAVGLVAIVVFLILAIKNIRGEVSLRIASEKSLDVYDIQAFYAQEVVVVKEGAGSVVRARMADATPSSGRSRYYDRNYDYWIRVTYTGKSVFSDEQAQRVKTILEQKHSQAHD